MDLCISLDSMGKLHRFYYLYFRKQLRLSKSLQQLLSEMHSCWLIKLWNKPLFSVQKELNRLQFQVNTSAELETVIWEFCLIGFAEVLVLFSKSLLPNSTSSVSLLSKKSTVCFTNKIQKSQKRVKNFNACIHKIKCLIKEQTITRKHVTCTNNKFLSSHGGWIFSAWVFIPAFIPFSLH